MCNRASSMRRARQRSRPSSARSTVRSSGGRRLSRRRARRHWTLGEPSSSPRLGWSTRPGGCAASSCRSSTRRARPDRPPHPPPRFRSRDRVGEPPRTRPDRTQAGSSRATDVPQARRGPRADKPLKPGPGGRESDDSRSMSSPSWPNRVPKSDERVVQAIAPSRRWGIGGRHHARARPLRRGATMPDSTSRASRLDRALADLLAQAPEVEPAAVVSFDGLPMASALPATMDEDRVAAMSAALLSLGERAAEGLGRGSLNQVYIEGEHGTVFLVSADDEAVLVAVAAKAAKVGMMLYEVRRAAAVVAEVLRAEDAAAEQAVAEVPAQPETPSYETPSYETPSYETPSYETPSYNPESYDLPRYDA